MHAAGAASAENSAVAQIPAVDELAEARASICSLLLRACHACRRGGNLSWRSLQARFSRPPWRALSLRQEEACR